MEERQVLASLESRWMTTLFASFQDDVNLYLVMEYLPGGDLASLIMKADEGMLEIDEDFVRFYVAEILLALQDLHAAKYVHR
jgi:protein-serine/threonine kinase